MPKCCERDMGVPQTHPSANRHDLPFLSTFLLPPSWRERGHQRRQWREGGAFAVVCGEGSMQSLKTEGSVGRGRHGAVGRVVCAVSEGAEKKG